MSIIKKWKQRFEERKLFKDRCEEFLTTLANSYVEIWKDIARDVIDYSDVKGFKISNGFSFINKNFYFFTPNYEIDIVDIAPNVFYDVIFGDLNNSDYNNHLLFRKENKPAEEQLMKIVQKLNEFNEKQGFNFLKIHTSVDSFLIRGISIAMPFTELKSMLEENKNEQ